MKLNLLILFTYFIVLFRINLSKNLLFFNECSVLYDCSSYVITCSIRSPSCMVISWSYGCSEFWLLWKVIPSPPPFFHFASFCVHIFFLSFKKPQLMEFLFIQICQLSARLSAQLLDQLSTRLSTQLSAGYPPGYLPGYLMLSNLTNQFIKSSDGNLLCGWNSDIFISIHS